MLVALDALESAPPGVDAVSGLAAVRLAGSTAVDARGLLLGTALPYQRNLLYTRPSGPDGGPAPDGPVLVAGQLIDHAGNATAVLTAQVVVDTAPPAGTLAIARGDTATVDGLTRDTTVSLRLTAAPEANGGSARLRLSNSTQGLATAAALDFTSPIAWPLATAPDGGLEGPRTVYAQLLDSAGNTSAPLSATITVDRTPPSPAAAQLQSPAVTATAQARLTINAADPSGLAPGQAVTVAENLLFTGALVVGPMDLPPSGTLTVPLSAGDGHKTLYVRFRDAAGNEALAEPLDVVLDTVPPSGTLSVEGTRADGTPSADFSATPDVTVTLQQTGASQYVLVDGPLADCTTAAGWAPLPSTSRFPFHLGAAVGAHTLSLCLRDDAGNLSGGPSALPETASLSVLPNGPTGCQLALLGARADGAATPAVPAGRTGRRDVGAVLSGCSATPLEVYLAPTPITCTATSSLPFQPFAASQVVFLPGADGATVVRGCVRDAAGNVSSVAAASIVLDTTPPEGVRLALDNGAAWVTAAGLTTSAAGSAVGAVEWAVAEAPTVPSTWLNVATQNPQTLTLGGQGVRTVLARFRDDVGNVSATTQATITVDTVAPVGGALTLVGTGVAGFTNSVSVTTRLTGAPADAAGLQVVQAASTLACALTDFPTATPTPFVPTGVFLLSPGDGLKRVCARLFDAAGNPGLVLTATVTLDTLPPSLPQLTTPPALVTQGNGTWYFLTTAAGVTEANFLRYERTGGLDAQWVADATNLATTTFGYRLASTGDPAGTANVLKLRALDRAGNIGPEASVTITTDPVPPQAVQLSRVGVNNKATSATVYWQPLDPVANPDVVGYRVAYGPAPSQYFGTGAAEGPSPFLLPAPASSVTLSGLSPGTTTYVTVRAVDRAGNEAPLPTNPGEVRITPNAFSPSKLADVTFDPVMTEIFRIVVVRDAAWVLGSTCTGPTATTVLGRVDLSAMQAAFQGGTLTASPWSPTLTAVATWPDGSDCYANRNAPPDLLLDGALAYLSSGTAVHVLDLNGAAPVELASVPLPGEVSPLALQRRVLFAGGAGFVSAVKLDALFDENAATRPGAADVIGTYLDPGSSAGGLTLSRHILVRKLSNGSGTTVFNVASTFGATPTFGAANLVGSGSDTVGPPYNIGTNGNMPASGNLFFQVNTAGLSLRSLANLWSGASLALPLVSTGFLTSDFGLTLSGPFGFGGLSGTDTLVVDDLSRLGSGALVRQATFPLGTGQVYAGIGTVASWGPYQLVAVPSASATRLVVLETAQPTGLSEVGGLASGSDVHELDGAFLLGRSVVDLQAPALTEVGNPSGMVVLSGGRTRMARFGERMVFTAPGSTDLTVYNGEPAVDRDPATVPTYNVDSYAVPVTPAGTRVLDLTGYGDALVTLETRPTGVYLRKFKSVNLRAGLAWAAGQFSMADAVAELRLSTFVGGSGTVGRLLIHRGRVFASVHDETFGSGTPQPPLGVTITDARAWFDDDAATTTPLAQGGLPVRGANRLELRGHVLWLTEGVSNPGLQAWDVSAALDENPLTTVTSGSALGAFSFQRADSLAVYGPYAYVASDSSAAQEFDKGLYAVDLTNPAAPRVTSMAPDFGTGALSVVGNRLYFSREDVVKVFQLE